VVDSFELNSDYSIIEANVPPKYFGLPIRDIAFRKSFNILALTVIKKVEEKSLLGRTKITDQIQGVVSGDYILEQGDIIVLYGANKDLQAFLKQKLR
jgi:trk system potassium uptake protein TrkA